MSQSTYPKWIIPVIRFSLLDGKQCLIQLIAQGRIRGSRLPYTSSCSRVHLSLSVFRCTYDYLEISETDQSQMDLQKLSLGPSSATDSSWYHKVIHKVFNSSSPTTVFNPALITAQMLDSDASVVQNNVNSGRLGSNRVHSTESFNRMATTVPRRICGDWSPKMKLLRYVTKMPALLFHFASDYSHQDGGYKAKVYIENGE